MPYLAVIADSFRAATKSKVLWVACVAIWILLALLAPSGTRETLTTDFTAFDLDNATRLKAMLADGLVNPRTEGSAVGRIAAAIDEGLKTRLERVGRGEDERIRYDELAGGLTGLLDAPEGEEPDWYDAAAWAGLRRTAEQERLEKNVDDLDSQRRRRLNRLRILSAFPGVFGARTPTSLRPTYAGVDFPYDLPLDRDRFVTIVNQLVLPTIISWLLGFVLIFLGIVVTAPIVPGMLQPGSLHLLLSKPISRTGLLLSKFVGGCAFVLLCVTQLVIGLYLILGLRLDVWNPRLLWCIPASVFLFSVFYAVSVAAGLLFRSEVLSIGITCCFGAVCLVTGVIGGVFDNFVTGRDVLVSVVQVDGHLVARRSTGTIVAFDAEAGEWVDLIDDVRRDDRVFDPVVIRTEGGSRMLTAISRGARFNAYGMGSVDLLVFTPPGDGQTDWDVQPTVRLPAATTGLEVVDDLLVAIHSVGLSSMPIEDAINPEVAPERSDDDGSADWLGKLSRMMGGSDDAFRPMLPPEVRFSPPRRVAAGGDGSIWIGSGNQLSQIVRAGDSGADGGSQGQDAGETRWTVRRQSTLSGDSAMRFAMAVGGGRVLHSRAGGQTFLLTTAGEAEPEEIELPVDGSVSAVVADDRGRFLTVFSDGSLWRLSGEGQWESLGVAGASAVCVGEDGLVLAAVQTDRVVSVEDDRTVRRRVDPSVSAWRLADRYVMSPLRFVVPQTGELGDVIASSISGRSEVLMGDPSSDQTRVARYRWFRPLVSCGGFIAVLMTFNVLFFRYRDY